MCNCHARWLFFCKWRWLIARLPHFGRSIDQEELKGICCDRLRNVKKWSKKPCSIGHLCKLMLIVNLQERSNGSWSRVTVERQANKYSISCKFKELLECSYACPNRWELVVLQNIITTWLTDWTTCQWRLVRWHSHAQFVCTGSVGQSFVYFSAARASISRAHSIHRWSVSATRRTPKDECAKLGDQLPD